MAKREMVESHVDALLKRITGDAALQRDSDGDWPFTLERSAMYVRVQNDSEPLVRVWAIGAHSVPESGELFTTLNDLNKNLEFCRALWNDGALLFATELVGESLDIEELGTAMNRVAGAAEVLGPKVIATCGGKALLQEEPHDPSTTEDETGVYL
jgi:hypothetical protein